MRLHAARRVQRGVTLFEVLIVVAIIALVSAGVAIGAMKYWARAQVRTAETNARYIRHAVRAWWIEHDSNTCPNVDDLLRDGTLDADSPRADPWGTPWRIECADLNVSVVSSGRDRQLGTGDDVRVPPT